MAEVEISHAFVSAKPDVTDPTVIDSTIWNALLAIGGGVNGQMPVRDTGQAHGARWTQGPFVQRTTGSYTGTGSSTPAMAANVVTLSTPGVVILLPYVTAATSANQAVVMAVRRNGSNLSLPNWFGTNVGGIPWIEVINEVAGTYTYDLIVSVSTGNLVSVGVYLTALMLGT